MAWSPQLLGQQENWMANSNSPMLQQYGQWNKYTSGLRDMGFNEVRDLRAPGYTNTQSNSNQKNFDWSQAGDYLKGGSNLATAAFQDITDILGNSKSQITQKPTYDLSHVNSFDDLNNTSFTFADSNQLTRPTFGSSFMDINMRTARGAMAGSALGPWGMLGGAIGGTLSGVANSITKAVTYKKDLNRLNTMNANMMQNYNKDFAQAFNNINNNQQMNLDMQRSRRLFAEGGQLNTTINTGGTHEQNPYGGVQMGIAPDGQPNLVEEGEVVYNDYVFSNRIKPEEIFLKQFNTNFKQNFNSYAEAANFILAMNKDRTNDYWAKQTQDRMMERLQQAQEYQKIAMNAEANNMSIEEYLQALQEQEEAQELNQQQKTDPQSMYSGGFYNDDPYQQTQALAQQEEIDNLQMPINQMMAYGGYLNNAHVFARGGNIIEPVDPPKGLITYEEGQMLSKFNQQVREMARGFANTYNIPPQDFDLAMAVAIQMIQNNSNNIRNAVLQLTQDPDFSNNTQKLTALNNYFADEIVGTVKQGSTGFVNNTKKWLSDKVATFKINELSNLYQNLLKPLAQGMDIGAQFAFPAYGMARGLQMGASALKDGDYGTAFAMVMPTGRGGRYARQATRQMAARGVRHADRVGSSMYRQSYQGGSKTVQNSRSYTGRTNNIDFNTGKPINTPTGKPQPRSTTSAVQNGAREQTYGIKLIDEATAPGITGQGLRFVKAEEPVIASRTKIAEPTESEIKSTMLSNQRRRETATATNTSTPQNKKIPIWKRYIVSWKEHPVKNILILLGVGAAGVGIDYAFNGFQERRKYIKGEPLNEEQQKELTWALTVMQSESLADDSIRNIAQDIIITYQSSPDYNTIKLQVQNEILELADEYVKQQKVQGIVIADPTIDQIAEKVTNDEVTRIAKENHVNVVNTTGTKKSTQQLIKEIDDKVTQTSKSTNKYWSPTKQSYVDQLEDNELGISVDTSRKGRGYDGIIDETTNEGWQKLLQSFTPEEWQQVKQKLATEFNLPVEDIDKQLNDNLFGKIHKRALDFINEMVKMKQPQDDAPEQNISEETIPTTSNSQSPTSKPVNEYQPIFDDEDQNWYDKVFGANNPLRYAPVIDNLRSLIEQNEPDYTYSNQLKSLYQPIHSYPTGKHMYYNPVDQYYLANQAQQARNTQLAAARNNANTAQANAYYQSMANQQMNNLIADNYIKALQQNDQMRNTTLQYNNQLDAQNETNRLNVQAQNASNYAQIMGNSYQAAEEERLAVENAREANKQNMAMNLGAIGKEQSDYWNVGHNPALLYGAFGTNYKGYSNNQSNNINNFNLTGFNQYFNSMTPEQQASFMQQYGYNKQS